MEAVDLSIFKEEAEACTDSDHTKCAAVNRLALGLKYFSLLNVKDNEKNQGIFMAFINDVYYQILDDHNHLILCHNDNLLEISEGIFASKCSMKTCKFTQRHFESESNINIKDDQPLNFYVNLFDGLHFWIYHSFDGGFRVKPEGELGEATEAKEDEKENQTLIDAEFERMNIVIRKTDLETEPFERISTTENTKFTISLSEEQDDTTYLDELYGHLASESVPPQTVSTLRAYVNAEWFDSDSVKEDLDSELGSNANIAIKLKNKECIQFILEFIKAIAGSHIL